MPVPHPRLLTPALLATAVLGLAAAERAAADAVFADFDNTPGNLGSGTLDGVGFTITATGPSGTGLTTISGRNYNAAQWGSQDFSVTNQETIEYSGHTVTITFDQAVSDLNLWIWSWRAGGNAAGTYGGADSYEFNQDFTLGANFSGGSQSSSDTLSTPTGWWSDGILSFSGPVTTISWTSYGTSGFTDTVEAQGFTFTGTAGSAPAVPGPAGAAAMLGLAVAARRRRR